MKIVRRTLAAVAVTGLVGLGLTGVAAAQTDTGDYTPVINTDIVRPDGASVEAAQVSAAPAVESAGTLPYTGSDSSLPLAEVGVGLLAAGGLMVVVVRRRQTADQS